MPPLSIMIKPVSGLCNMRCRYCFYADVAGHRKTASYGAMTQGTLETLVRRALAYADGEVSFAFQGGEPTLAGLPFYESLLDFQARWNTRGVAIHNSIQTNAYQLTDEMADFFARNSFLVGVSLDGFKAAHDALRLDARGDGTYDAVKANIAKLTRAGAQFNILCVVNSLVASQPALTFESLRPYGYMQFIACIDGFEGEISDYSLTAPQYADFLIKTFDLYHAAYFAGRPVSVRAFDNYIGMLLGRAPEMCSMSGQCGIYYLIEADGGVYPCDFYVLDSCRLGNINEDSFFRLAGSPVGLGFREASLAIDEKCRSCRWRALCRGGCRRDRDLANGELGLNRWCEAYRRMFEACYPKMNEIAADIKRGGRNAGGKIQ